MGSFLSGIWKYIAGVGAALGAILLAALYVVKGQRDDARESAQKAKESLAVSEKTRNKQEAVNDAAQEAREKTNATERKNQDRPPGVRPDGQFRR